MDEATATSFINIRNDVANLQKDVVRQEVIVNRFDTALDKISEVSLNVSKLLAVHEQRLEAHDHTLTVMSENTERRVLKYDAVITGLADRIIESEMGLRKEMQEGQKEILSEIKSLRNDMVHLGDELKDRTDKVKEDLEKEFTTKIDPITDRVTKLERLTWIIIGGAAVIGFLLSQALGVVDLIK